jgi:phospho-N-acetylmuramoyl-pentapeptide-transferase
MDPILNIVKVLLPAIIAFVIGIGITPLWTTYLYKNEMWKKKAKTVAVDGYGTPIFNKLHQEKEVKVPRLGGVIIWATSVIVIAMFWMLSHMLPGSVFVKLDFLSRDQTWIPLMSLLIGAIIGFFDDILEIRGSLDYKAGGLSLKKRLVLIGIVGLLCAFWFYFKLEVSSIGIPFHGDFSIGWLFIPLFVVVLWAIYSGGVIDGLDGLAGGVFATMFSAYAIIAFSQQQINLAAFCAVVVGSILAFLWFNIPPARFYMTETGSMALTLTLTIVAFMTDSLGHGYGLFVLPIIALPLIVTTASVIIQVLSKKFRHGKKVFLVAPLHHHFEAIGWPAYKITMRYWIISLIAAGLGVIIALIGHHTNL